MFMPKVFVLVLSYNGLKWLKDCLPSVVAMDYSNYETVVIDNGSSDGTQEFLSVSYPQIQVVSLNPNRGYAGGFNAGLEYAAEHGAEYFLVMNNDTEIDPHALTALVETAQSRERFGFVTGKVYFHDRGDVFQSVGKQGDTVIWGGRHIGYEEKDVGQYDKITKRDFVDDIYVLVSRDMYDETGGYDSQLFLHCEELDWQLRAKKAGWQMYYTPHAWLWHHGSVTIGGVGSAINNYFLERSRIIVMAKHGALVRLFRYIAWSGSHALYRFFGAIYRRNPNTIKPRLARIIGIWAGLFWLVHRQPITGVPKGIQKLSQRVDS